MKLVRPEYWVCPKCGMYDKNKVVDDNKVCIDCKCGFKATILIERGSFAD